MTNTEVLSANPDSANSASANEAPATEVTKTNGTAARRKATGLSGMVLAELRELAGQLGITGTTGMRKGDLIAAIKERQGSASARPARKSADGGQLPFGDEQAKEAAAPAAAPEAAKPEVAKAEPQATKPEPQPVNDASAETAAPTQPAVGEDRRTGGDSDGENGGQRRRRRPANRQDGDNREGNTREGNTRESNTRDNSNRDNNTRDNNRENSNRDSNRADTRTDNRNDNRGDNRNSGDNRSENSRGDNNRDNNNRNDNRGGNNRNNRNDNNRNDNRNDNRGDNRGNDRADSNRGDNNRPDDDEDGGNRRGRRFRDRRRNRSGGSTRTEGGAPDTEIREDDVLLPVAGILDVLENYAFVRTSGYLAGPNDVYVSLSLVRRFGLRRGDAITGVIRQPRDGEQNRQKFNPLVRVDTINGVEPDQARKRPDFTKLTPLYPNERLRLETEAHKLTTRVIDLVMPVGKGQRALIVSPPKAGKTTIMQDIANAIATNNPECYLMVVLVDERPEEVTDMQRSIKGEVIASTFDRPPSDHTAVAELAIERAKRLVETGNDVVVLLDSITRLGRAYNNSSPASGRILSGGIDSTALYPPKKFLGAARNIENGGSLTIFATAMVETGSNGDTVIFEEFKGTGNAELKLDRKIAERRVFPAVDINPSGTRKDELLLSPDERAVITKLGRVLHALDSQQAIDTLLHQLRKTKNNVEFLMQVSKTTPGMADD